MKPKDCRFLSRSSRGNQARLLANACPLIAIPRDTNIPKLSCMASAIASTTTCSDTDAACMCIPDNKNAITTAATECVVEACGMTKALQAVAAASETCSALASASVTSTGGKVVETGLAAGNASVNATSTIKASSSGTSVGGSVATITNGGEGCYTGLVEKMVVMCGVSFIVVSVAAV